MSLELGGKTPMIVFDDADLDAAVPVLAKAVTTFTGQFCMTGSRILVQRGIADELRTRLSAALEAVKVGPGDDPASEMGPLIDRANADRVDREVAEAAEYAKVLVRGGRVTDGPLAAGAFVRPSLVEVEDVDRPIVQREIFGPVATYEIFDDEAGATARANATEFGLAASIWTRDVDRPLRVGMNSTREPSGPIPGPSSSTRWKKAASSRAASDASTANAPSRSSRRSSTSSTPPPRSS